MAMPNLDEISDSIKEIQQHWVMQGYEGVMVRSPVGGYEPKYRSYTLLKYKSMINSLENEEEFMIVGAKEGRGRDKGTVIWKVKDLKDDNVVFDVRPKGTHDQRSRWWRFSNQYVGKLLTIQYQNRSSTNVPIFPVGIAIRDYE